MDSSKKALSIQKHPGELSGSSILAGSLPILCISEPGELTGFLKEISMPTSGYNTQDMNRAVHIIVNRQFPKKSNKDIYIDFTVENLVKTLINKLK